MAGISDSGSTTITSGTTTSGAISQNSVSISGGKLIATNGISTSSGVTNSVDNGLEVQAGTINSNVSGSGSVNINASSGSVSLYDGKIISQAINLSSGTFISSASGIQGGVSVTSGSVQLTGGALDSAISGSGSTEILAGSNTVSIGSGSIANALTVSSGTLAASLDKLTGTVTNNATLNLSGDITKNISGLGSTVLQSSSVAVTDGTSISGTLNINSNTLDMKNTTFETLTVGNLLGSGNLTLDVNAQSDSSDVINISSGSANNSSITITDINFTKPVVAENEDSKIYSKQILTGYTSGAVLTLSDALATPVQTAINRSGSDDLDTNSILWSADYGAWSQSGTQTEQFSISPSSGTLADSLKYELTKVWNPKSYSGKAENLAIMNSYSGTGSNNRSVDFSGIFEDPSAQGTYTVTSNLGQTEDGKFTLSGETGVENRTIVDFNTYKGFELDNNNTELVLKDLEVKNSSALVTGTAATGVKVTLDNVNLHDNGTGITTAGSVDIKGNSTISDNITVTDTNSQINVDGTDVITLDSTLTGTSTSKLNLSNGTINLTNNAQINTLDTTLTNVNLNLANETQLAGLNTTFEGTNNFNMVNNSIGALSLGDVSLNGVLKMQVDADLANAQMDRLSATSATIGSGGKIEVSKINLLSPTSQKQLDLLFTDNTNLAGVVNYTGEGQIVYSPIYKYNTSYSQKNGKGYFSFVTQGSSYDDFNPAIMATSVTSVVSGYQNQMQALQGGFYHMDRYMKLSDKQRFAAENYNKFALLEPVENLDIKQIPETTQAMWTIPYSTFERVNLKGGLKVNNTAYGMTYGGDSDMYDMGHGFKGVTSVYIGYNGNHMSYDGITMQQNGGFLGGTLNAYRGNFFTGLTVSAGASVGDANTMYGHDDITMLTAGVANKTGYNIELIGGRLIIQPSLFLGYTWVNTFDYTNSAGARIKQDPLNALQVVPGVKVIGNTKSGWQPYAGIDMVWNIFMGGNKVRANDVTLPKLSEKPFVQYGVGVQKTWADRFTGFLQAMVRNGGRNGVVLSAGFRWTFGKSSKKTKKPSKSPNL